MDQAEAEAREEARLMRAMQRKKQQKPKPKPKPKPTVTKPKPAPEPEPVQAPKVAEEPYKPPVPVNSTVDNSDESRGEVDTSSVNVLSSQEDDKRAEELEEARLMRALGRGGKSVRKPFVKPKPARNTPPTTTAPKKEIKKPVPQLEIVNRPKKVEAVTAADVDAPEDGVSTLFEWTYLYDPTAKVYLCGSWNDYTPIKMGMADDSHHFIATIKLANGKHYYRFKIDGKFELDKQKSTSFGPTGNLMNSIEIGLDRLE